jgi:glucan phosphoethanolaminetransferase (alkaline phosphatase superfamily)
MLTYQTWTADLRKSARFLIGVAGLALLPLIPELWLWFRGYSDFKALLSIAYYECIASFLFCGPALLLPRRGAKTWLAVVGILFAIGTLATGFQAVTVGARWDSTTHAAIMETNPYETAGFLHAFVTAETILWLGTLSAAFAGCLLVIARSTPPSCQLGGVIIVAGVLLSTYGIHHAIRYGGNPVHRVQVSDDTSLDVFDAGINSYHPVLRLLATQWNYSATHKYRLRVLREMSAHLAELKGAAPVAGATTPRAIVLVIGESASRRHWGLYGYPRETTPELAKLGNELYVFRDTVCRTVGTLTEIQGMLCTDRASIPIFALFSDAGYKTHWFSAQLDQGPNDVKLAAIVQSCDERVFLNGAYDENLVPLVQHAMAEPGKHFIVVNLFGSHVRYDDRYPARYAHFAGTGEKVHLLAAYDNSIRYTDYVLAKLIDVLRHRAEPTCFLYLSDHAEDVYDSNPNEYLFRSDSVATDAMYEIPMVAWFSPEYRRGNPNVVTAASAATSTPFQSVGLYHSLIDLARLRHRIFDPRSSLFSGEFAARDRKVGVLQRVYHPATKPMSATANLSTSERK